MAEKNKYDVNNLETMHRGSVIFRDEIDQIVTSN